MFKDAFNDGFVQTDVIRASSALISKHFSASSSLLSLSSLLISVSLPAEGWRLLPSFLFSLSPFFWIFFFLWMDEGKKLYLVALLLQSERFGYRRPTQHQLGLKMSRLVIIDQLHEVSTFHHARARLPVAMFAC